MKEKDGYVKKYGLLIASATTRLKKNEDWKRLRFGEETLKEILQTARMQI